MKNYFNKTLGIITLSIMFITQSLLHAQQFNSDNYLSKPHGVSTIILTAGERNLMFMTTFSLLRKWEFTAAAYLYNSDKDPLTDDGHSLSFYAKYMIYENKSKTGGLAVKFGTGLEPGFLDASERIDDAFRTYWTNAPITFGFFGYRLSWDIMPGASVTRDYGTDGKTAWAFNYSTRLAWYPFNPELAVVGELYGSAGEANTKPEYRTGLRWEPNQYTVFALTFDDEIGGNNGAGVEIGLMLFTPPFFGIGNFNK